MIHALAALWRDMGIDVDVGSGFTPDADIALLHHNVTRVDPSEVPAAPDGIKVLNGEVLDISKRLYSELRVTAADAWNGPVIIKTNLNSCGRPELQRNGRSWLRYSQSRIALLNWKIARCIPDRVYPVLDSVKDVPGWVWEREDLLVERFVPEREDGLYSIRGWVFLGSGGYGYRLFSKDPMVKVGSIVRYEYIDEVPPELQAVRESMKFDYGKFDYVVHDGQAVLFDANKTPTFTGDPRSKGLTSMANAMTELLP